MERYFFIPIANGFETSREISEFPCTVERASMKEEDLQSTLKFQSKVVSRCHAILFLSEHGQLLIQDTKSSSGTFVNGVRLSLAGVQSLAFNLHDGDIIALGEDCELNGALHKCIVMQIIFGLDNLKRLEENPYFYNRHDDSEPGQTPDLDYSIDQKVFAIVKIEFNAIWKGLDEMSLQPVERLSELKRGIREFEIVNGSISRV